MLAIISSSSSSLDKLLCIRIKVDPVTVGGGCAVFHYKNVHLCVCMFSPVCTLAGLLGNKFLEVGLTGVLMFKYIHFHVVPSKRS